MNSALPLLLAAGAAVLLLGKKKKKKAEEEPIVGETVVSVRKPTIDPRVVKVVKQ